LTPPAGEGFAAKRESFHGGGREWAPPFEQESESGRRLTKVLLKEMQRKKRLSQKRRLGERKGRSLLLREKIR